MISLKNVGVQHSNVRVLEGINAEIPSRMCTAIVGPNGSGKSTLLRAIAGVQGFDGSIEFAGKPLSSYPRKQRVQQLAFVEQSGLDATDAKVREIVELGRLAGRGLFIQPDDQDQHVISRAMTDVDIVDFSERRFSTLSGGEQQRTHVSRALAQDAGFMVLDEPTNHLDLPHQHRLLTLLQHLATEDHHSAGVLIALHDLALAARYCDNVLVLNQSRLVATGPPKEVLTPSLLAEVFRIDAQLVTSPRGVLMLECFGELDLP